MSKELTIFGEGDSIIIIQEGKAVIGSRLLAEGFEIKHKSLVELIGKYFSDLKRRKFDSTGGRPSEEFFLDEEQATFLGTLVRNNPKTVEFKRMLVKEFFRMRNHISETELPTTKLEWMKLAVETEEKNQQLLLEHTENKPKVEYYEKVSDAVNLHSMISAAKILNWGRNLFMKRLRKDKILFKSDGGNIPYQRYIDAGYFEVKERVSGEGIQFLSYTTFVTGRGIQWLFKKYGI